MKPVDRDLYSPRRPNRGSLLPVTAVDKLQARAQPGVRWQFRRANSPSARCCRFTLINLMHDVKAERFVTPHRANDMMESADADTVEYFNLVLGVKLTKQEKSDLMAFMRAL